MWLEKGRFGYSPETGGGGIFADNHIEKLKKFKTVSYFCYL